MVHYQSLYVDEVDVNCFLRSHCSGMFSSSDFLAMFYINLYFLILIRMILVTTMTNYLLANCISEDGLTRNLNSSWINNKGCLCNCVGLDGWDFIQCEECKSMARNGASPKLKDKICRSNGFEYYDNETWMSSVSTCHQCKCQTGGEIACVSDKHCSNTCPFGQVPKYGDCCEVIQCSRKSPPNESPIKCRDPTTGILISQGKVSVSRHSCVDRLCICYNGDWMCHNYCQLSNGTFKYWHRLCCSRSVGTQQCKSYNQTLLPGEKIYFKEIADNCTCLNGLLYCDKSFILNLGISFNDTSLPHSNKSLPILITLLCLIGFIFCCFIIIIFYNNFDKFKQKFLHKDKAKNEVLLTNIQEVDPKITEYPIEGI